MSQTYQTKNYTAHGGAETVIGGKLTFLAGAVIDDQAGVIPTPSDPVEPFTPAAAQADSEATTVVALKSDFNDLLAKLRTAGLMAEAAEETPAAGGGDNAGGGT